jgi:group II intron reverse transcriptase/maturase
VLGSLESKACNENYRYQRLYRNLYNPEFYLLAYRRIQSKPGNMTAGTDGLTIDGMGLGRINTIIEKMREFSYQPKPARRVYIAKTNGKKRPLGIPSFDDKLVQEVIRLILESIYEPTFHDTSHGFRPHRSCHTALISVKRRFTGVKWFVEGDIKGCFDNIDHHVLVSILRRRIDDEHFIGLIWKFLKAGYMEGWAYNKTYSGTPQGSIISPVLANIYLNELDGFIAEYAEGFNRGARRRINPAYKKVLDVRRGKQEWLGRNHDKTSAEKKRAMEAEIRGLNDYLSHTPYGDPMDEGYRRLVYVRYADDFLIGLIGSKEDANAVKADVGRYLKDTLNLDMSEEKTLVTHSKNFVRFLGYDIAASKVQNPTRQKNGSIKRSRTGRIVLSVPKEKWLNRLISLGSLKIKYDEHNGNREVYEPVKRPSLVYLGDIEILSKYNAEVRGMYNYYRLAHNATVLQSFLYVMKYSMYKTFACKYQTRISRIVRKYRKGKDFAVTYETKAGTKTAVFYNKGMRQDDTIYDADPDVVNRPFWACQTSTLIERVKNNACEVCGKVGEMEVHHVRKLKDLSDRTEWERQMKARRRKTLVICPDCHTKLHAGNLR